MTVVYGVLAVLVVFVIAAVVVGREARRLDAVPPRPVFDRDESVAWVADHLPPAVTAELSYDDVSRICDWNLEYFRSKGGSGNGSAPHAAGAPVVVGGAETVEYVLARAQEAGSPYTSAQVHAVLDAQLAYLQAIGAVGPEAPPGEATR